MRPMKLAEVRKHTGRHLSYEEAHKIAAISPRAASATWLRPSPSTPGKTAPKTGCGSKPRLSFFAS
jgi:hypothetical protein